MRRVLNYLPSSVAPEKSHGGEAGGDDFNHNHYIYVGIFYVKGFNLCMFDSITDLLGAGREPERASFPVSVYRIFSASFPSQDRHMVGEGPLQGEERNEGNVHRVGSLRRSHTRGMGGQWPVLVVSSGGLSFGPVLLRDRREQKEERDELRA